VDELAVVAVETWGVGGGGSVVCETVGVTLDMGVLDDALDDGNGILVSTSRVGSISTDISDSGMLGTTEGAVMLIASDSGSTSIDFDRGVGGSDGMSSSTLGHSSAEEYLVLTLALRVKAFSTSSSSSFSSSSFTSSSFSGNIAVPYSELAGTLGNE
jgi:hypothetical protein